MILTTQHSCILDKRDVQEAIVAWLQSRKLEVPQYVGDTPTTTWTWGEHTVTVQWTDEKKD
jgi:hypothetical protein